MVLRSALREVRVLMKLRYPLIIRCERVFFSNDHRLYAVFPFVDGGCGHGLLKTSYPQGLPPQPLKSFAWQLCLAVQYLHSQRVLHRDIKPANVLLSSDGTIRLCDFGFARWVPERRVAGAAGDRGSLTPYVQTRPYRAPEVLLGHQEYGFPADIWSLGLTIVEMATGATFLNGHTSLDQLWRILGAVREPHSPALAASLKALQDLDPADIGANVPRELLRPPLKLPGTPLRDRLAHLDPSLVDLVEACLRLDPARRATAAELLRMPYFVDVVQVVDGNATLRRLSDEWLEVARGTEERGGVEGAAAAATALPVQVQVPGSRGAGPGGSASYTHPRDAKLEGAATMKPSSSMPSLLTLAGGALCGGINPSAEAGRPVAAAGTAIPKTARAAQQESLASSTAAGLSRGPSPAVPAATAMPRAACGLLPAAEGGCLVRVPGPVHGPVGAIKDTPAAVEKAADAGSGCGSQAALCQSGLSALAEVGTGETLLSLRMPAAAPTEPSLLWRTEGAQGRQITVPPPLLPPSGAPAGAPAAPTPLQPPQGTLRGTRQPHSASAPDMCSPEHRSPKVGPSNPATPPDTPPPPMALLTSHGLGPEAPRLPRPAAAPLDASAPAVAAPLARRVPSQLDTVLPMSPYNTLPYGPTIYYIPAGMQHQGGVRGQPRLGAPVGVAAAPFGEEGEEDERELLGDGVVATCTTWRELIAADLHKPTEHMEQQLRPRACRAACGRPTLDSEITIDCGDVECEGREQLRFTATIGCRRGTMLGYVYDTSGNGSLQTAAFSTLSYAVAWATGVEPASTSMSVAAAAHRVAESQQAGFRTAPAPIDSRDRRCCEAAVVAAAPAAATYRAAGDERVGPFARRGRHRRSHTMPAQRPGGPWDAPERAKGPVFTACPFNETLSYPVAQQPLQQPQKACRRSSSRCNSRSSSNTSSILDLFRLRQRQRRLQQRSLTGTSPIPIPSLGVDPLHGRPYGGSVYGSTGALASLVEDACSSWHTNAVSGAAGPSCWHDSRSTPIGVRKGMPYGSSLDYTDSRLDAAWSVYGRAASAASRPLDAFKAAGPGDPSGMIRLRGGDSTECSSDAVRGVGIACGLDFGLGRKLRRSLQMVVRSRRRGSRGG